MPGSPARLTPIVYTSQRYIARGLAAFSPSLKAAVGLVGVRIASTDR
jgi:hypothetical protein